MTAKTRFARLTWAMLAIAGLTVVAAVPAHAQNVAPVISGTPPTNAIVGTLYDFTATATDANGDKIAWNASGMPRWAFFDKRIGRLYGTPAARDAGTSSSVTITASDGKLSAVLTFTVKVASSGTPWISGTPPTSVREGDLYAFLPGAGDPDGQPLSFSIKGKPSWATFDKVSGLMSGIPPAGSAGTTSKIQISVTDGSYTATLPAFSITIGAAANSAPKISGTPPTSVYTGLPYSFQPTASDPDGQALSFSVLGKPAWASFSASTGALSGTPASTDTGTYSNIIIVASDGITTSSLPAFSISVLKSNTVPTISGVPSGSATIDKSYSFIPSAKDPDGQTLTYAISNRPAWASFNSATGQLAGTPASGTAGTYSNIVISVSDGQASASLPAFSIVVASTSVTGSATLSWTPPTQNTDGTPITDLAGFRIRYGQTSGNLDKVLDIASAAISSAVIESLAQGTWYFAVKAYNAAGVESDLSPLASKTIN